jgi:hypothetical protein
MQRQLRPILVRLSVEIYFCHLPWYLCNVNYFLVNTLYNLISISSAVDLLFLGDMCATAFPVINNMLINISSTVDFLLL